jgi:hypothetical protein
MRKLAKLPKYPTITHTQKYDHPHPTPTNDTMIKKWIEKLTTIGHVAKIEAHKIIIKQFTINHKQHHHNILDLIKH